MSEEPASQELSQTTEGGSEQTLWSLGCVQKPNKVFSLPEDDVLILVGVDDFHVRLQFRHPSLNVCFHPSYLDLMLFLDHLEGFNFAHLACYAYCEQDPNALYVGSMCLQRFEDGDVVEYDWCVALANGSAGAEQIKMGLTQPQWRQIVFLLNMLISFQKVTVLGHSSRQGYAKGAHNCRGFKAVEYELWEGWIKREVSEDGIYHLFIAKPAEGEIEWTQIETWQYPGWLSADYQANRVNLGPIFPLILAPFGGKLQGDSQPDSVPCQPDTGSMFI